MDIKAFARLILAAQELSDAFYVNEDSDEPALYEDQAFVELGGDPALQPFVELLFRKGGQELLALARLKAAA